ncbi:MAG: sulfatase [Bryobacterales bacterium]|nr:sulfatase [Bryobacterales bacterium]
MPALTRRQLLRSTAAAALPGVLSAQGRKRNIVFILTDDHRYDIMSCAGHPWVKTPGIDRLARGGVMFDNAFVTSSLCSPSRASILTGLYPHAHKIQDNFTELDSRHATFPQLLRKAGYKTAFLGKWHMGGASDAPRPGFDHWFSFFGQGEYFNPKLNVNGKQEQRNGYITDILTAEAEQFIEKQNGPFMLYLSHKAVHSPFEPAPRHREQYKNQRMPRPKTMWYRDDWYASKPDWVRRRRFTRHGVDGAIGHMAPLEDLYLGYCRSLSAIDESTGRILDTLERRGLLNDTLVVYMGDNGYMWGDHGLIDKRAMYDPSIRVPMLMHCPDLFGPGRRTQYVLNNDIMPTFLDAAGIEAPPVHGRSLLPVLRGQASNWRTDFLYEYEWERDFPYTPTIVGLRTTAHSLIQSYGLYDLDELYDMRQDPDQMNNLLAGTRMLSHDRMRTVFRLKNPELAKLLDGLQGRMEQLLRETGGDPRLAGKLPPGAKEAM